MAAVDRILLVTDLTPPTDRALERAVQLAVQFDADLTMLAVVASEDARTPRNVEAEARRHLMAVPGASEVAPMVAVAEGDIAATAAEYAGLWNADLMVTGIDRRDQSSWLQCTSTAERISVASPAPLLAVRSRPFGPYASALVAVDFLDTSARAVTCAMTVVAAGGIHLLHVLDAPGLAPGGQPVAAGAFDSDFRRLLTEADGAGRTVGMSVRVGPVMDAILHAVQEEGPDILVMGTEGRRGIGRTLLGSTAHDVLDRVACDVLLVRAP